MAVVQQYGKAERVTVTITSNLTRKYQATIPRPVRELLGLDEGDYLAFEIEDAKVVLRRVTPFDVEHAVPSSGWPR